MHESIPILRSAASPIDNKTSLKIPDDTPTHRLAVPPSVKKGTIRKPCKKTLQGYDNFKGAIETLQNKKSPD
jgi:hypothetical protein